MLDALPIGSLAPAGVAALAVILVLTGRLIPRRTYEDMRQELREDRDKWREAHGISEQARRLQSSQVEELMENTRTTAQFINNLPRRRD